MMRTIPLTVVIVFLVAVAPITGVAAIQETNTGLSDQTAIDGEPLIDGGSGGGATTQDNTTSSQSAPTATAPGDDWFLLSEDSAEDPERIETIYAQYTDDTVYFKVEYSNISSQDDFNFAVIIDSDQSTVTGLNSSQDFRYDVNDIGADYAAVFGVQGEDFGTWSDQNETWYPETGLAYTEIQESQNTAILGVDRDRIGNPAVIDVVFADSGSEPWDYVPDEGDGHIAIELSETSDSTVTVPFTEEFSNGLNGWTVGKRDASRSTMGSGEWSAEHGGSARLHVDGSPSTIQLYKETEGIPAGSTITANYTPERFAYAEAGIGLFAVTPDGERVKLDYDNDQEDGNYEQNGTLRTTVSQDYPAGTKLEIKLVIWPGETTVYVTNITATAAAADGPTAAFNYAPQLPTAEESITFNASDSSVDGEITSYEWDFDGYGTTEATGVTATHAFDSAGEHNVTLTVTDDSGQTDTRTKTVQVVRSDQPTVYLEPMNGTVSVNGTTTFALKMSNVDGGVGAFDPVNVTLDNAATASIEDISTPFSGASTTRAADGSQASVTLPFGGDTADTGTVELATVTVRGETPGHTTARVTVTGDVAREDGSLYENVSSADSDIQTRVGTPALPGMENPPTNVDGDGKLEDVNGNDEFDIGDIQALFTNRNSDAVQNNAAQFDFNNNGGIDIGDIQALFQEYMNN